MSRALVIALVAFASLPISAQAPKQSLCEDFRKHLSERGAPKLPPLEEIDLGDGKLNIPNIDVDGDKIADQIILFRTGSSSIIPADDSSLTLVLSSSRESFTVEFPRFYVFRYNSKIYVVGTTMLSENGAMLKEILSLDRKGITHLCSYTCGLTTGCSRRAASGPRAADPGR